MKKEKKLIINLASCIVMFAVSLGISFFVTPYITNRVGSEAYGFVSLAINFTSYASIITLAINSMSSRFISIAIFKKRDNEANEYFNSVLISNVACILFFLVISILLIIFLQNIINIPNNLIVDVKILFAIIFLNFLVSLINSVYAVSTYASDHIELYMIKLMEANIIKIMLMIILFYIFGANIIVVGIGYLIATLYEMFFNIYYMKKFLPMLYVNKSFFKFKRIWEIFLSGIWNTVTKLGQVFNDGLDLLISNILINPLAMGQLSIAKTISSSVALLTGYLTNIFQPAITKYYAENSIELENEIKFSMRVVSFFSNILLVGIIAFGISFYKLWIPNENIILIYKLTLITILGCVISTSVNPLFSVFTLTNKLKANSLVTLFTGFFSCLITFLCIKFGLVSNGIYLIASLSVIISIIKNLTFTPMYSAKCLGKSKKIFYKPILQSILSSCVLFIIFKIVGNIFVINSWVKLIILASLSAAIGVIVTYFIMFNKVERNSNLVFVKEFFNKKKKAVNR